MNVYEGCGEDDFEENLSKYFFPTHFKPIKNHTYILMTKLFPDLDLQISLVCSETGLTKDISLAGTVG